MRFRINLLRTEAHNSERKRSPIKRPSWVNLSLSLKTKYTTPYQNCTRPVRTSDVWVSIWQPSYGPQFSLRKKGANSLGSFAKSNLCLFCCSLTRHPLAPGLGSCPCAIAQSPVSATDQQRHQVGIGQVAQATSVQDGPS